MAGITTAQLEDFAPRPGPMGFPNGIDANDTIITVSDDALDEVKNFRLKFTLTWFY